MLPLAVVQEIRRFLDAGELSQRKIACQLGVSRGTVGAIASGRRGTHGREPNTDRPELCCYERPPKRCRGCGARVYLPCILCRTRAFQARHLSVRSLSGKPTATIRRVA
ncbi:MAG: hypothetical protein ACR2NM_16265 [Bythopirellula sp.]